MALDMEAHSTLEHGLYDDFTTWFVFYKVIPNKKAICFKKKQGSF